MKITKLNWLKKDDSKKPINKRYKNIVFWCLGFVVFALSIFGLCVNNYSQSVSVSNYSLTLQSTNNTNSVDSIKTANDYLNKWNVNPSSLVFIANLNNEIRKCNDKAYVESIIQHSLTNEQHNLIKNELSKVSNYYNTNLQNTQFAEINTSGWTQQLNSIIENSTIQLSYFGQNLLAQKDALGATGVVIGIILCVLAFFGLNLAVFVPLTIIGLVGICCGISSDVLCSLCKQFYNLNQNIYNNYFAGLLPKLSTNTLIMIIQKELPCFKELKNKLEQYSSIIGVKEMLKNTNHNISELENLLSIIKNTNK